ncbi:PAS domain-containing protein [Granulicella tundricola]|uniref:RNA-binding protein KhpA n=1 Tax=Granulicella tundricola (strain ATCC BAA-1859 / DSM 23138 / MP5ACTX9) TaxID=1198114 RepID=E8X795_GRATM|nr:PAS domain-containing protein [Granulicella tundricola]ADW71329.1 putative PAS/PAC sensor protein [Granulicella tundricola MP5ACTX9]
MKKSENVSASGLSACARIVGASEMAGRVRNYIWRDTLLGPIEGWPHALVSSVNLALNSSVAAALYWGPELIFICNDASVRMMGDYLNDFLGLSAEKLWMEHWPNVEQQFRAVLTNGESFTGEGVPFTFKRANPSDEIHFTYSLSPIYDEGSVVGIYRTLDDMTGQVVAMRNLAEANERLRMALTAGCLGVWDWHIHTGIVYADETTAKLYSIDPNEAGTGVSNKLFERMLHLDDIAPLSDAIIGCITTGKEYSVDVRVNRGDGSYRWVRSMGRCVYDKNGHAYRVTGLKSDVTDLRRSESKPQAAQGTLLPIEAWEKLPLHMQSLLRGTLPFLVDSPDQIRLVVVPDVNGTQISLRVAATDLGKAIGKQGRTIRAFRTILQAVNGIGEHRYSIDIESRAASDSNQA